MSKCGQKVESCPPEMASRKAEGSEAIDHLRNDPEIRRALALVLMRQAIKALEEAEEDRACRHLQAAIDSLLERYVDGVPSATN